MAEDLNLLRFRYHSQKYGAGQRGIPFLLTFAEWLKVWTDSGHLHERGQGKDNYCMARFGDKGPYAVGNVKIITVSANSKEVVLTAEARAKMSKAGHLKSPIGQACYAAGDVVPTRVARRRIRRGGWSADQAVKVPARLRPAVTLIQYLGKSMTLSEACRAAGNIVKRDTAAYRLRHGWSHRAAVETPPEHSNRISR